MKNSKMTLDAFKANAEVSNETIALNSIQGGALDDCHGISGAAGKAGRWVKDNVNITYGKDGWGINFRGGN